MSSDESRQARRRPAPRPLPVIDLGRLLGVPRVADVSSRVDKRAALRAVIGHRWEQHHAADAAAGGEAKEESGTGGEPSFANVQQAADSSSAAPAEETSRKRPARENPSEQEHIAKRPAKEPNANDSPSYATHQSSPAATSNPGADSGATKPLAVTPNAPMANLTQTTNRFKTTLSAGVVFASHDANNHVDKTDSCSAETETGVPNKRRRSETGVPNRRRRCIPLETTPDTKCSSTIEEVGSDAISFSRLANYPEYVGRRERCAMCGLETPRYDKQTSRRATLDFRGVCSICRDKPWKIADGGFEIKYCQHCKTWRQWADFRGLSGLIMVKKCGLCRIKINVARYPTAAQTETAALTNGPRCIPLVPTPVTCSRATVQVGSTIVPLSQVANYPQNIGKHNDKAGTRKCVMCSTEAPYVPSKLANKGAPPPHILHDSLGVCTICQNTVWKVLDSGLEIRCCRQCGFLCSWGSFQSSSGMTNSCEMCRTRMAKKVVAT